MVLCLDSESSFMDPLGNYGPQVNNLAFQKLTEPKTPKMFILKAQFNWNVEKKTF